MNKESKLPVGPYKEQSHQTASTANRYGIDWTAEGPGVYVMYSILSQARAVACACNAAWLHGYLIKQIETNS